MKFAVLEFVGGTGFWFSFRHLDEQEDELNKMQEGHLKSTHLSRDDLHNENPPFFFYPYQVNWNLLIIVMNIETCVQVL